jgi:inosine-uridine nucleoside N-ribohydrolase
LLVDLLGFFSDNYRARHDPGTMRGAAVHDPLAVLTLTHPDLFGRSARHVAVETRGEHTRGMTVIDQRAITARAAPNCDVLTTVDHDAAFELLIDAIAHFSR